MKKLLGIVVLGFLISINLSKADEPIIFYKDENKIHIAHKTHFMGGFKDQERIASNHCKSHDKFYFMVHSSSVTNKTPVWKNYKQLIKKHYKRFLGNVTVVEVFCSKEKLTKAPPDAFSPGRLFSRNNYGAFALKVDPKKIEEEKRIAEKKKKQKPKKKVPKIVSGDDKKVVAAASGTGFFVSRKGHIITNNHVIQGCDAVKVSFTGDELKAKTLAVDKMNDLAIIKANINPSKVYSVAAQDASLLEDIIIAGYPLGKRVSSAIKTSKGSVTALAGYGDNFSEFQTDAALNQGNSGGPIMNQKGNVIGVAVANFGKKEGVESFNFGIKASTLRTFANSNGLKFLPPNRRELSNKDLGELITSATVYLECYMTVAKIKRMIAEANNRKAFFSEYQ